MERHQSTRVSVFTSHWIPACFRNAPPLALDTALAVLLAVTLVRDLWNLDVPPGGPIRAHDALGYVLVAMLVLPLALRRRFPLTVFITILVDAVVVVVLFYRPTSFGFGLIVATYSVGRWRMPEVSVVAMVAAQVFGVLVKLRAEAAGFEVAAFEWPLDAAYFGAAWFLGWSLRSRSEYAAALESSREALAQRAVQDERTRIARELHDAVGHSISVMTLHVGAAGELLDRQPDRARQALTSAGEVGRAAMGEMDQLVGLLRSDQDDSPGLLQPSLANLDTLLDEFRSLGIDVHASVGGVPTELPRAVDLSAFRIIQEALTNTLKHAGPTEAEVTISYAECELALEIADHGRRPDHRHHPVSGHQSQGIIGMRERVAMLNGEFEIDANGDLGYRVAARLPLTATGSR